MVGIKAAHHPAIVYRPIGPSDLGILEQIHCDLFPIRYESEFFLNVVHGREIVSWGAVDRSRPGNQSDELIGFVTARIVLADDSEIGDMLRYDSRTDQTLVYILTLGVVESYRNHGIATSLTREVIKYASTIPSCRAVYLHVIAYNRTAICFYKKLSFQCVRRLRDFYYIKGQHYDSYLFVYYVNGGQSPCSPLDIVAAVATYMRSLCKSLVARLWRNEDKNILRWPKCKDTSCLLVNQSKRNLTTEGGCQCV
ncbi:N-acetyltransferase protein [Thalictrum thalictroides]|uniref:N-alpha-acetyltransferase 60 n=1 Tax=Thalictrum thalictroides TaxID=46969 RepID=A0A7J6VWL8_THATH|nr:N-acetyltransferase protein [Thalictrum thalictroides]